MASQNNQSASVNASTDCDTIKKRKKGQTVDEHLAKSFGEMRELRPLIKQSVDSIARALEGAIISLARDRICLGSWKNLEASQ
ncbi:unnamed protein product [Linum trigynum]|uniref:Uncharacterized protein n=1 Tax=Linum trigynum TaxID=586398 RepID=A0AAV2FBL8_9ROSI